jgi:glutamine amidotransferase
MCRLLGYLGQPLLLDQILTQPDHSLIVQSYQPREMTAGLLNADGFGIGWYHAQRQTQPFTYRSILPIWNDVNLPSLSRYVESGCVVANVRSATPGLAVDLSNCQPFQQNLILFTHNGFVQNFRQTLYRPLRDRLSDVAYQTISGLTDSEHIFALFLDFVQQGLELSAAIAKTLQTLTELAEKYKTTFSANLLVSDGQRLVACRYASTVVTPTLYMLSQPTGHLIASEPIFAGEWKALPDRTIVTVRYDHDFIVESL